MCLIPFLPQVNAKLVKEVEEYRQFGTKMFDELHIRLAIEDD